jgi:hypothetical protein
MPSTYEQTLRWRHKHRDKYLEQKQRENQRRYEKRKKFINEIKQNNPCTCGESDIVCLDLHHINPATKKRFRNGKTQCINQIRSPYSARKEAKKCVVICANCHRKGHAGRPRPEHAKYFKAFRNPT